MGYIYSWIKDIIIYLILITVVMNLLGKSNYKRYIGVFTGMILVILVVSPLIKFFHIENTLEYYFAANKYTIESEDISGKMVDMESQQQEIILKEYKNKIKEQVNQIVENQGLYPVSIEVEVYEEKENSNFGTIKTISIVASREEEAKSEEGDTKNVDKVAIDKIKIASIVDAENESNNGNETLYVLSIEEIEVKNTLADFYNIPFDNINISIQE